MTSLGTSPYLIHFLSALDVVISLVASAHVVLTKRDTRAAIGWIGLIWLSPILGTVLYVLLGINRISRRARLLRRRQPRAEPQRGWPCPAELLRGNLTAEAEHLEAMARLG